jgi:hypothetical protein
MNEDVLDRAGNSLNINDFVKYTYGQKYYYASKIIDIEVFHINKTAYCFLVLENECKIRSRNCELISRDEAILINLLKFLIL